MGKKRMYHHRRKPSKASGLPVLTLEEQVELANKGIICSGRCDCSSLGGPRITYFTIYPVDEDTLATVRGRNPREVAFSIAMIDDFFSGEENPEDFDFGLEGYDPGLN